MGSGADQMERPNESELIDIVMRQRVEFSEDVGITTGNPVGAADILRQAGAEMAGRAATYDKPEGERSMGATVAAFEAVTGISLTEEQGWLFMSLLKAVRSQQGRYRADSYVDGAAYFALAGEAAARDRT